MKNFYKPRRIHFIVGFGIIFITLGILKCTHPEWRLPRLANNDNDKSEIKSHTPDSIELQAAKVDKLLLTVRNKPILLRKDGSRVKNRVTSVPRFETSFPDLNDVQLATAKRLGIPQIQNREEAHKHMQELVPRAARLLNVIARAFNDSLATKGYPPHKLLITSVLRTKEDVQKLRNFNQNASENSCHQFGTTFDVSYNRFWKFSPMANAKCDG